MLPVSLKNGLIPVNSLLFYTLHILLFIETIVYMFLKWIKYNKIIIFKAFFIVAFFSICDSVVWDAEIYEDSVNTLIRGAMENIQKVESRQRLPYQLLMDVFR